MSEKDKFVKRVSLRKETVEELKKAKESYKKLDESASMSSEPYRLPNGKLDRDKIIRRALADWNERSK